MNKKSKHRLKLFLVGFTWVFLFFTVTHLEMWRMHYSYSSNNDTEALLRAYDHLFKFNQWP